MSYKIACAPSKNSQADQSFHCPSEDAWDPLIPKEGPAKTLIRVFAGSTCNFVENSEPWLYYYGLK